MVTFRWYGAQTGKSDIDAAVDRLIGAISTSARRWSMHSLAMARAEFRNRLRRASEGKLVPVQHVKEIGRGSGEHLFEIRWQDISVHEVDADGKLFYPKVMARLYHSEPGDYPAEFIGLHAHEKVIIPGNDAATKAAQNAEIDEAVRLYHEGRPSGWGIE